MIEELLLTGQTDSADRQRAVIAQGMRTYPDAHILKKGVMGPFNVTNDELPGVTGYRYYIKSASVAIVNLAGDSCNNAGFYTSMNGSWLIFLICPCVQVAGAFQSGFASMELGFMTESGQPVYKAINGIATQVTTVLVYALVKDGDE